jgi:hypothetical protein
MAMSIYIAARFRVKSRKRRQEEKCGGKCGNSRREGKMKREDGKKR